MANWSYLHVSDASYNPGPEEYKINSLYQGKYLVPIFWYLLFESDDFVIYKQMIECDSEDKIVSYPGFTTERQIALKRLNNKRPFLNSYFTKEVLSSLDSFIEKIEDINEKFITVEAREISMMYEEPQQCADKFSGILVRMNTVCSNEEIEHERINLIRAVLDSELRNDSENMCLYSESEGKFHADPTLFVGTLS